MGCGGNRPGPGGVQRVVRTVGVGLACALVAGCGGGVVGTPVAELWDPCSLPAEVLEGAGVESGVVDSTDRVLEPSGRWRTCTFRGLNSVRWTVFSTDTSYTSVRSNPRAREPRDTRFGNRDAVIYKGPTDAVLAECFVALPTSRGAIEVKIADTDGDAEWPQLCGQAESAVRALLPYLPR